VLIGRYGTSEIQITESSSGGVDLLVWETGRADPAGRFAFHGFNVRTIEEAMEIAARKLAANGEVPVDGVRRAIAWDRKQELLTVEAWTDLGAIRSVVAGFALLCLQ
jgi:hypothetical protein